ncbi:class I SAM-dependent methyltransferase [Candidatus Poribacteria bacterium]|nr:class I SAM-dependent methyltransferase [Candidatus Poribacteria bacterium]
MKNQDKMFFYEQFAGEFDRRMNRYDLNKRLRIIFEEMLTDKELTGKSLLDAGCGTGWFSQKAVECDADVTALDVGEHLLEEVRKKYQALGPHYAVPLLVKGDICDMEFADNTFDYVISTEVIEHTPNPRKALQEMHRVLKHNGVLLLTVPNRIWHFAVVIGNTLKLRPYEGYEN